MGEEEVQIEDSESFDDCIVGAFSRRSRAPF